MKHSLSSIHAPVGRWGLLTAVLLLVSPLLLSVHHHAVGAHHEACVVCTFAHAPALAAQTATAPERPHRLIASLVLQDEFAVALTPTATPLSRAPPRG